MVLTLLIQVLLATATRTKANELITSYVSSTYDWDSRSSSISTTCVNIPRNLSLCTNMDYNSMRLPNLLDHDSLSEVSQQAASWVPLVNIRCHVDTQRFICSLFCPICLDHPIYPCRSLCEKVKAGCEKHMKSYGYPWPAMFQCSQFPMDNDMCVKSQSATESSSEQNERENEREREAAAAPPDQFVDVAMWPQEPPPMSEPLEEDDVVVEEDPIEWEHIFNEERCRICEQVNTMENILDNYCQSSTAIRVKLKQRKENLLVFKILKIFKVNDAIRKNFKDDLLRLNLDEECCRDKMKERIGYFIMGNHEEGKFSPTFIMPWVTKRSQSFKKSIRMIKTLNCTNVDAITRRPTIIAAPALTMTSKDHTSAGLSRPERKSHRRNHKQRKDDD